MGTGGKLEDCCLDGCSCNFRTDPAGRILPYGVRQGIPPYGLRGGQSDWIKTLKVCCVYLYFPLYSSCPLVLCPGSVSFELAMYFQVTVLRRLMRMENNYRAWLIKGLRQPSRFLFPNADWYSYKVGASLLSLASN